MMFRVRHNGREVLHVPGQRIAAKVFELARKRLSLVTQERLDKIGNAAMDRYLNSVTTGLERRHSRPYSGRGSGRMLSRRSGEGIKRLRRYTVDRDSRGIKGTVRLNRHMKQQEFGGVIRAKNGSYLTIPLPDALDARGLPKKASARQWRSAFVIKSKRGKLLIVRKSGRRIIPLYVLQPTVRIPPRLGLRKELKRKRPSLSKDVRKQLSDLMRV